ncbi:alcohol dehydrogenase catalytic domain-containing protein [Streptomyces sp. NPDC057740]|uniref:alcohol dehydrogenase catalytic domain-containing protein n=1 Tax=Streptomyces sp. NPDC057740 TaxID=3346234 RepID=UPI003673B54A
MDDGTLLIATRFARRGLDAALSEAGVVVGADGGQHGDLLTTRPHHPTKAAAGQSDGGRGELGTTRLEEFTQVMAVRIAAQRPPALCPHWSTCSCAGASPFMSAAEPPYVPGMDAAGVVERIGEGTDTDLTLGDRVMAVVVVSGTHGAYAEQLVVPAQTGRRGTSAAGGRRSAGPGGPHLLNPPHVIGIGGPVADGVLGGGRETRRIGAGEVAMQRVA